MRTELQLIPKNSIFNILELSPDFIELKINNFKQIKSIKIKDLQSSN